jgi:hypothetical protein
MKLALQVGSALCLGIEAIIVAGLGVRLLVEWFNWGFGLFGVPLAMILWAIALLYAWGAIFSMREIGPVTGRYFLVTVALSLLNLGGVAIYLGIRHNSQGLEREFASVVAAFLIVGTVVAVARMVADVRMLPPHGSAPSSGAGVVS